MASKIKAMMWCAAACLWSACAATNSGGPERFATPEQAVERLEQAVERRSPRDAARIFGAEGEFLLYSGDEALDKQRAQRFVSAFNEQHVLTQYDEDRYMLQIGRNEWPFPVPIVKDGDRWIFDAAAGRDEILACRVGENELRAMAACRAVAQAQWIYSAKKYAGGKYAAKLRSSPGTRDGLYWPAGEGEERSPLGVFVAKAADEGYDASAEEPQPLHGYLFKLFAKEPRPGRAAGSYWLTAQPVAPGETGVMLFACNERGWIYEKPWEEGAAAALRSAAAFEVDPTWTRVE